MKPPSYDPLQDPNYTRLSRTLPQSLGGRIGVAEARVITEAKLRETGGRCIWGRQRSAGCGNWPDKNLAAYLLLSWGHVHVPGSHPTKIQEAEFIVSPENVWPQCQTCNALQGCFKPSELLELLEAKSDEIRRFLADYPRD